MIPEQLALAGMAGGAVGFTLGLVGGGGSILAVPLLLYFVGVADPHVAIGTSALAVAASAAFNLANHARFGNVKWRCASVYATAGVFGALLGATAGKAVDGQKLLMLFSVLMLVVSGLTLRSRKTVGDPAVVLNRTNVPRLVAAGGVTGLLSGFFGIGGGFLVVPGLMTSTGMPILFAVGSSLLVVTAFGLTTALSYAASGLVDWTLAGAFIAGATVSGLGGAWAARRLAGHKGLLNSTLALVIAGAAVYMLVRGPQG